MCDVCGEVVRLVDASYSYGKYKLHKKCLPNLIHKESCYCGSCKTKFDLSHWWPKINSYSDLRSFGHMLTRETKSALLTAYTILKKFGLPKDVSLHILSISVSPHGNIINVQNGLGRDILNPNTDHHKCVRCNCEIYNSISRNYPVDCAVGNCTRCGLDCSSAHCRLAQYSNSDLPDGISEIIGFDPIGLTTRQTARRVRYLLNTTEFSDTITRQLYNILKKTI